MALEPARMTLLPGGIFRKLAADPNQRTSELSGVQLQALCGTPVTDICKAVSEGRYDLGNVSRWTM